MIKKATLVLMLTVICLPLFSAEVSEENKIKDRIITQGEFAVLYCQAINLEKPTKGWSPEISAAKLTELGIAPESGWQLGKDLTEGEMVYLVQPIGINLVTAYPDRKVTVRKANAVFVKFKEMFRSIHPELRNITGENATYIEPLGNPSKSGFEN